MSTTEILQLIETPEVQAVLRAMVRNEIERMKEEAEDEAFALEEAIRTHMSLLEPFAGELDIRAQASSTRLLCEIATIRIPFNEVKSRHEKQRANERGEG